MATVRKASLRAQRMQHRSSRWMLLSYHPKQMLLSLWHYISSASIRYFQYCSSVPFLHFLALLTLSHSDQNEFLSLYDQLWQTNNATWDPLYMAILNLVFALGCQFHSLKAHDKSAAQFQAQAAKIMAPFVFGTCHSMRLVQAWLLMTMQVGRHIHDQASSTLSLTAIPIFQWQTSARPGSCWTTSGNATRLAHALGLHLDADNDQIATFNMRQELRRRVWATCTVFDR